MSGKGRWYLAALVATALMATLGVFVREVSPGNEYAVALGRFSIGLACLMVLDRVRRLRTTRAQQAAPLHGQNGAEFRPRKLSWTLIGSGAMLPLFVVCYFKAVLAGTIANAAFLLYLGPLIASTLAALWLGEGLNRTSLVLLGLALFGTVFITEFKLPDDPDQAESLIFGLLSGLFYGLFLLLNNRKAQGNDPGLAGISYQFLVATLIMIPVTAAAGIHLQWGDLPWIVAVGALHGFVALTLVITSLRYLKTVEYGTISYSEPLMAALVGVALYQESISPLQMIGGGLVLIAGIARVFIQDSPAEKSGLTP